LPELPDVTVYIEALERQALSRLLHKSWPRNIDALE